MITIRYFTQIFRPDYAVTLRGNFYYDWSEEYPGVYQKGAWIFKIPYHSLPARIEYKFYLERQYWQESANFVIDPVADNTVIDHQDAEVKFQKQNELVVENSCLQRTFIKPNLNEKEHYDTIVIGSGMGGGIVAEQLADFGKKVLVLEAGSYIFPTHIANLPRRQVIGKFDKHLWNLWPDFQVKNFKISDTHDYQGAAGFNLGGRSVFWGALIPRPAWWELDSWPQTVRYALEDTYFGKAEELMKLSRMQSNYQNSVLRWFTREFPELHFITAPMAVQRSNGEERTLSSGVFDTASLLMEALMTADTDITVNLNHAVNKLNVKNGKVTGVTAYDLISSQERTYSGDRVILCAGSIESPKIAQLSGISSASGKLGKGLTDHQIFYTHFGLPAGHELFERNASAKLTARYTVTDNPERRYLVVIELGADFNQGRYIDPELVEKHLSERQDIMLCEIVFLCESPLIDENEVVQSGPSYEDVALSMIKSTAADHLQGEMAALKDSFLSRLSAVPLSPDNLELKEAPLGGVAHEVGTLRLDELDKGVVDTNLKFNDYENLYCCDMSVLPNSMAANPSLTLAALALRLADHLNN